jgi:kynurenine formamidase
VFSSKALYFSMSDHAGTHVDAPVHFDPRPDALSIEHVPLEKFYTSAICLDLSHVPLKHAITVAEMEAALTKSGQEIRKGDTVLIWMATNERLLGKPGYLHDFPGLALESVHWLADRGIGMFGVEAISPAPEGEPNFQAHMACAERGITHMECLANLDKLIGRGRFTFIGFPLKIRGGTASPIRAVAMFP